MMHATVILSVRRLLCERIFILILLSEASERAGLLHDGALSRTAEICKVFQSGNVAS